MSAPTAEDMRDAILGVWLGMRYSVSHEAFCAYLRGREKACLYRAWAELESIWARYSTPDAAKKAEHWAAWQRWLFDNALPAEVLTYAPPPHSDGPPGIDFTVPDDGDPWANFRDPNAVWVDERPELLTQLRAAGWQV